MKKIYFVFASLLLAGACQQEVVYPIDYTVELDKENTYYVGEPVKFNFSGEVDNIVFYSGEIGHQYDYKDRYAVDKAAVKSATMDVDYQARYGLPDGLEVYVSNTFPGLSGNDAAADKATIKAMVDGGMQGWQKLDYNEGKSQKWTKQSYELNDYMENFSIAFHWCPKNEKEDPKNPGKMVPETQRTYWIKGAITLDLEGMHPSTVGFSALDFVTVMMNDEIEDPYKKNAGNGSFVLNKPATADIIMQGIGKGKLPYALDGWVISKPAPLNKVENDKGVVIKNLQNYLHTFEYTWTEPGTYKVVFLGRNENFAGGSQQVETRTITIVPKPIE